VEVLALVGLFANRFKGDFFDFKGNRITFDRFRFAFCFFGLNWRERTK